MIRPSLVPLAAALLLVNAPALVAQERSMITTTGMELVWIPSGEFMMGSWPDERKWAQFKGCPESLTKREGEKPRRTRIVNGFWLGRTEVTLGQWRKFVNATSYVSDAEKKGGETWRNPKIEFELKENHPACCMSWNDAAAFCSWLTATEKKANRLPVSMIFRLPAEAEWECACRAGSQAKFWWGDKVEEGHKRVNWLGAEDGFSSISPVDQFGARGRNRFGLADMLGNMWEWCLDGFDPEQAHEECYKGNPAVRVCRGGSFDNFIGFTRCATRNTASPSAAKTHFGFRVSCGVPR
ncbi:MAG: formylglycine-generating enzyme family protein [Verrucomicrobia bacterium]|nr:formylglycine-generating enzyme family protein [Verrucomicrobiota bacterium]